jgi:hypothetical protein
MNMSPPQPSRMVQKIRRLAASLGIQSRPLTSNAAAGVRPLMRSTDEPNIPAAHFRVTGRRRIDNDHDNPKQPITIPEPCKGGVGKTICRGEPIEASAESSSAGESHPRALTEPDVNLAAHPALSVPPPRTTGASVRTALAGGGPSVVASAPLGAGVPADACTAAAPIESGSGPGAGTSDTEPTCKTGWSRSPTPEAPD